MSSLETVFNVRAYGAKGDGVTDDAASIQAAITACSGVGGGSIYLPRGHYIVGSVIRLPALCELVGDNVVGAAGANYGATTLKMKTASNVEAVVAHDGWYANDTGGLGPIGIRNLNIDANASGQTGSTGYGFVSSAWRTSVRNCTISNARSDGVRITSVTRNGATEVTGNIGEPRVENCVIDTSGGAGFAVVEGATPSKVTDGWLVDCTIRDSTTQGVNILMGAGWVVAGNHVYGTGNEGIFVDRCYATKVVDNYVEFVGAQAGYGDVPGILVRATWDCIVANNTCFIYESFLGAGNYPEGIFAENFSGNPAYFAILGNSVYNYEGTTGTGILVRDSGSGGVRLSMPVASNVVVNWLNPLNVTATILGNAQSAAYAATITPTPLVAETILVGTLTGPITVANVATGDCHAGTRMTLKFTQDATGGRVVTFGASYKTSWTPVTTANKINTISFVFDGSSWIQTASVVGLS